MLGLFSTKLNFNIVCLVLSCAVLQVFEEDLFVSLYV